jgi:hypothetical protein
MDPTSLFFILDYFYIQWMNSCTWIFWNAIKVDVEVEVEWACTQVGSDQIDTYAYKEEKN